MVVGGLLVAVLLLIAAVLAALRSTNGRRALIARATQAVREATGLEVTVGDVAFDLGGRRVVLDRVTIAAKARRIGRFSRSIASRPCSTRLRSCAARYASSRSRRERRRSICPLRCRRPWPSGRRPSRKRRRPTSNASSSTASRSWASRSRRAAARLGDVRVEDVRAVGSLRGGQLELAIDRGVLLVSGQAPAPDLRANLTGRVAGALQGPFTLDQIRLAGDGITAEAGGVLGLDASDPLQLRATVDAAPGRLFPEAGDGRVSLTADLDLRAVAGTIDAQASALPAELLETALGADLFASLGAAGTLLEGDLRLRLAGAIARRERRTCSGEKVDSDQALLIADLATVDARGGRQTVQPRRRRRSSSMSTLGSCPAWSGRRTLVARVRLPSWERFADLGDRDRTRRGREPGRGANDRRASRRVSPT